MGSHQREGEVYSFGTACCASTGLPKHATPFDRRFPDFQCACAKWGGQDRKVPMVFKATDEPHFFPRFVLPAALCTCAIARVPSG